MEVGVGRKKRRKVGPGFGRGDFLKPAKRRSLVLSPLPCWEHLSSEQQREKVTELVREIEEEAAVEREAAARSVLGRAAVLQQKPHERPLRTKRSYAPLFHAASRKARRDLYDGYRAFVAAFREAAALLRAGHLAAVFPAGSFAPALPFVGG